MRNVVTIIERDNALVKSSFSNKWSYP